MQVNEMKAVRAARVVELKEERHGSGCDVRSFSEVCGHCALCCLVLDARMAYYLGLHRMIRTRNLVVCAASKSCPAGKFRAATQGLQIYGISVSVPLLAGIGFKSCRRSGHAKSEQFMLGQM